MENRERIIRKANAAKAAIEYDERRLPFFSMGAIRWCSAVM